MPENNQPEAQPRAQVPSLDELMDTLSTAPGEPSSPPPAATAPEGEPEAEPAPEPAFDAEAEFRRLREELETERKRREDTQRSWQAEHAGRLRQEEMVRAYEEARRREEALYAQARQMQPPQRPELVDEETARWVQEMVQWSNNWMMAQVSPYAPVIQHLLSQAEVTSEIGIKAAAKEAKAKVSDLGLDDFDEVYKTKIREQFLADGPNGRALLGKPEVVVAAYLADRAQSGKPFTPTNRPKAPVATGAAPAATKAQQVASRLSPLARQIAKNLDIEPFTPTEEQLKRARAPERR